uniref:Uncharacterized protein LOC114328351 n=1 Tax=Diabrotica virgifera virgifera TaxID=50390 RepID=A0A6P7FAS9_DIAVI
MKLNDFVDWKTEAEIFLPTSTEECQTFFISKLQVASLQKGEEEIKGKYSYSDTATQFTLAISSNSRRSQKGRRSNKVLPKGDSLLYPTPLPLSTKKLTDLMRLVQKKVIQARYWDENQQKMTCSDVVPDALAETDADDDLDI